MAAEAGKSVLLVEKYGFADAAAVPGMPGTVCGMYLATDAGSAPEQVVWVFTKRGMSTVNSSCRISSGMTRPGRPIALGGRLRHALRGCSATGLL
ncbi:hypothetical protein HNP84_005854 [Thermocatellispora tengchongensis]|uniref:Uncharacterized protein n=1 Tax=Thermocatellispora tengchongensis TaxID=1073253 RepID=A0A840PF73_9ACTN|nr:FAD-dependent oxidoreductase [Thermocatellispora tengchongensis]MBB5136110.1 hypothetical protein [Thermocatellispora tengchongensis]